MARAIEASASIHVALEAAVTEFYLPAKREPAEADVDTPDAWLVQGAIASPQRYFSRSVTICGCAMAGCGGFPWKPIAGEAIRTRNGSGAPEFDNVLSRWFSQFPAKKRSRDATQLAKVACFLIANLARVAAAKVLPVSGQSPAHAIPLHQAASW